MWAVGLAAASEPPAGVEPPVEPVEPEELELEEAAEELEEPVEGGGVLLEPPLVLAASGVLELVMSRIQVPLGRTKATSRMRRSQSKRPLASPTTEATRVSFMS